ncbi:MAG TPA: hypothetical protein VL359_19130, partial [bacterium]|nr:hypothetical protein [bacterium]
MDSALQWVPIAVYVAGWLAEFVRYWRARDAAPAWAGGVLAVGWGAHSFLLGAALLGRTWQLATLLSGAAWWALVAYFLIGRRWRLGALRFILPPLAVALLLAAIYAGRHQLVAPGPAMPLPWLSGTLLAGHIVALLAGHLLFALACLSSVAYLLQ